MNTSEIVEQTQKGHLVRARTQPDVELVVAKLRKAQYLCCSAAGALTAADRGMAEKEAASARVLLVEALTAIQAQGRDGR